MIGKVIPSCVLVLGMVPVTAAQQCEPEWLVGGGFETVRGPVNETLVFDDGTGPAIYAGGLFSTAGGLPARNIARWDGAGWSQVGDGLNQRVFALHIHQGELYAGGRFSFSGSTQINRIAKWDGAAWVGVGAPLNDDVYDLMSYNGDLYAAGLFDGGIARWDGTQWSFLGSGLGLSTFSTGIGRALREYDGKLAIGGQFDTADGLPADCFALWDGNTFEAPLIFSGGSPTVVHELGLFESDLILTGRFNQPLPGMVRWDGSSVAWMAYSGNDVNAFFDDGGVLFAGNREGLIRFDGSSWSPAAPRLTGGGGVLDIIRYEDNLVAAGDFENIQFSTPAEGVLMFGCPSCYPDCDGSQSLDIFDFLCFQDAFTTMDPYADCDNNTTFDIFDFLCFQDAFITGCP